MIPPAHRWFRRDEVAILRDGDQLLVQVSDARALRLNETAGRIWERLEYPNTSEDIARWMRGEFAAAGADIHADVERALDALHDRGLIGVVAQPTAGELERHRYLWLLKRALVGTLYAENELRVAALEQATLPDDRLERQRWLRDIASLEPERMRALDACQHTGTLWQGRAPRLGHTAVGLSGLDNIERCAEAIFAGGIPGDFLEAGVLAGGASIFMRALQRAHGERHRSVWLADSFQGLPAPTAAADVEARLDLSEPRVPWLCRSLPTVRENFVRYDLLDEGVRFLPGWFKDTLPMPSPPALALLRIDADLYESTMQVLSALYDSVSPGGFVIIDDYYFLEPCRIAVDEFRATRHIDSPLKRVDPNRVFWRKVA